MPNITLTTTMTQYGVRLTDSDDKEFRGHIERWLAGGHNGGTRWQFKTPDRIKGPVRKTLAAAQYDALAHWEDQE